MSNGQRIGLIAAVVVAAIVAFVIAKPGGDDNDRTNTQEPAAKAGGRAPTTPKLQRIVLKDHAPQGGVQKITATKGQTATFEVDGDKADTIHLHGYNIEKDLTAGKPLEFSFPAKIDGVFEIESHVAEHEGKEPLIARLYVEPK